MKSLLLIAILAQPQISLEYPAEVTVRDLLCFDATQSTGDHFAWQVHYTDVDGERDDRRKIEDAVRLLVGSGYTVEGPSGAKPKDYRVVENGKLLFAPSVPGRRYIVFLAVSDKDGLDVATAKTAVKPLEEPRPPIPPPDDDPPDDPVPPDDDPPDDPAPPPIKLDYSADAKQWLKTVPAGARDKTLTIAKTLVEIGSRGAEIGSIQAIDALLSVGIAASVGDDIKGWEKFLIEANEVLEELGKNYNVTPGQYGEAVQSIGEGIIDSVVRGNK